MKILVVTMTVSGHRPKCIEGSLRDQHQVYVVAPDRERSATGHKITLDDHYGLEMDTQGQRYRLGLTAPGRRGTRSITAGTTRPGCIRNKFRAQPGYGCTLFRHRFGGSGRDDLWSLMIFLFVNN